ncbi:hypothetical protein CJ255_08090, partial [Candidatus Viridilinea mediisalina]
SAGATEDARTRGCEDARSGASAGATVRPVRIGASVAATARPARNGANAVATARPVRIGASVAVTESARTRGREDARNGVSVGATRSVGNGVLKTHGHADVKRTQGGGITNQQLPAAIRQKCGRRVITLPSRRRTKSDRSSPPTPPNLSQSQAQRHQLPVVQ